MNLISMLDAKFKEQEHPRDPEGKFTSGGGYSAGPNLASTLKEAGFTKMKGKQGFEHPSGMKVAIHPPEPGKSTSNLWTSYFKGHKPKTGKGTAISKLFPKAQTNTTPSPQPVAAKVQGSLPKVDVSQMKQVSGKLGSNEGGIYEDQSGNKYYVKESQSDDHAKNEVLAAQLYKAVGMDTLNYVDAGPGLVATQWGLKSVDNFNGMDANDKKKVQMGFAVHAWLANWDCIGASGDNQAVVDGKVTSVDMGGSLLYRAQGKPKGSAFNNEVTEWNTLRDGTNPQASAVFGKMTPEELKASAMQLQKITPAQIMSLVSQFGPGDAHAQNILASTLMTRRDKIIAKANEKPKPPSEYSVIKGQAPDPTPAQKIAIAKYSDGHYGGMNNYLRYGKGDAGDQQNVKEFKEYLDTCSLHKDMTVYRGVKGEYAKILKSIMHEGASFQDKGFLSTSVKKDFGHVWASGGLQLIISAPKGSKGAPISHIGGLAGEAEVVFQAGSKLKVTKVDGNNIHCDLDQS